MLMTQVLIPCWIKFYLPSRIKTIQWYLASSSFFLVIDYTVTLDGILNGWCNLILRLGPMPQKVTVPPQIKKIPLSFPVSWISLVLSFISPCWLFVFSPGLQLHQVFISRLLVLHSKARSSIESSFCSSSSSFSLRVTKLLKTVLNSSPTFSNPRTSYINCGKRFFQTPFMVTAVTSRQANSMFFMAL